MSKTYRNPITMTRRADRASRARRLDYTAMLASREARAQVQS
jgi:hypothetical protein